MRTLKHPEIEAVLLEQVFHALSDPVRLEIVRKLARQGALNCTDLECGRPKSTLSHHFRVLRDSGLVRSVPVGTTHVNELRRAELDGRFPGLMAAVLGVE